MQSEKWFVGFINKIEKKINTYISNAMHYLNYLQEDVSIWNLDYFVHHQDLSSLQSVKINLRYKLARMLCYPNRIIKLISTIIYQPTKVLYASILSCKRYILKNQADHPPIQRGKIGRSYEPNP